MSDRLIEYERAWTEGAAALAARRADRLIDFAEERAGAAEVRDADDRDFGREALEELADARNYLVWFTAQVGLHADRNQDTAGEIIIELGRALAGTVVAFEHAHRARVLMAKLREA